jgi:DHA1 family multidrug resistance protein-like MFS transporter
VTGFNTSGPIIPFFLQNLGVHDQIHIKFFTGLINALPAICLAVAAPVWGNMADNFGRKPMLLRAMFGGTLVLVLQGFVTDPWQLLILKMLQGAITGTVAAATVMVASIAPEEETGSALGLLQMAVFLGASVGPMFGGVISDFFGYRITFFTTAGLLFIAGLVVARYVQDDFVPPKAKKSSLRRFMPDFSPLAHSKALWSFLAVVAADQVAGSIVGPFLPLFVQSLPGPSEFVASTTGLILGLGALASAFAAFSVGKISYRLGYGRTLVICMVLAAVFTIPQAFVTSPLQLLLLRLVSCFFIGGNMPSVNALIAQQVQPGKQGSVYGLTSSVSSTSNALGPVIGATMAASMGFGSVFLGTGLVLGVTGCAIAFSVRHTRGPKEEDKS